MYGTHGICKIVAIEAKIVDRKTVDYYALEPVVQPGTRYYIPIHNSVAVSKLRPILTRSELDGILRDPCVKSSAWIEDENSRKQYYKDLLSGGDRLLMIRMINTLVQRRAEHLSNGKKFHQCDDNFLKEAQKLLDIEFSIVLNIPREEVRDYISHVLSA